MRTSVQQVSSRLQCLSGHIRPLTTAMLEPVEAAKRLAARSAVDEYIKTGQKVGIGSGSTIVYAVERLAERVVEEGLEVECVATSFQSELLVLDAGLKLSNLSTCPKLDVTIDGADEVDANLNCIKGGGACQTQEKVVASCASKFVIIADYRKESQSLGEQWKKGVPIEVIPSAYVPVMKKLEAMGGTPHLRMAVQKAGPIVSDNGNFIIDADFGIIGNPEELHDQLVQIPGILENGLFVRMAEKAYFGQNDGSVTTRVKN